MLETVNRPVGEGEALIVMGIDITVKLSGEETGNAYTVVELKVPPGAGPGMHIDTQWAESWYVIEGTFSFTLEDKEIEASAGNFAYAPKGIAHSFKNIGQSSARILMTGVPAGVEKFFQEINRATQQGNIDKENMLKIIRSHGIESPKVK